MPGEGTGPLALGMEQTAPAQRCLAPTVERTAQSEQRTAQKPLNLVYKTIDRSVPKPARRCSPASDVPKG